MAAETITTYRVLFEDHDARDYKDVRAVGIALKRFAYRADPRTPKPTAVVETTWRLSGRRGIAPDDFAAHNAELKRLATIEKKAEIEKLKAELELLQIEDEAIEDMGDDA